MSNQNSAAFPLRNEADGLTKLEYFTAAALTGLLASWAGAESDPGPTYIAEKAVSYAQEILKHIPS